MCVREGYDIQAVVLQLPHSTNLKSVQRDLQMRRALSMFVVTDSLFWGVICCIMHVTHTTFYGFYISFTSCPRRHKLGLNISDKQIILACS